MKNTLYYSKILTGIVLAISLSACASYNPGFVPTAVHYNKVVEDTNNELLVLNVIRAKERRPMYFTRISALRSNFTVSANGGVNTSFPQQDITSATTTAAGVGTGVVDTVSRGVNTVTPSIGGSYSTTPGFDYQILDSQDFYRGILNPISLESIAHYMLQGWTNDFVSMLTIESIEVRSKDGTVLTKLDNDPDNDDEISNFKDFLSCAEISPKERKANQIVFDGVKKSSIKTLGDVDLFNEGSWAFNDSEDLILSRPLPDTLTFKNVKKCFESSSGFKFSKNASSQFVEDFVTSQFVTQSTIDDSEFMSSSKLVAISEGGEDEVHIVTRSIQGVMYYLGECLRAQNENCSYISGGKQLFISSLKEKGDGDTGNNYALKTSLYGKTYFIPKGNSDTDRTFQSLAFVNQMLNLQKAASAAPSTSTVRLVN